MSKVRVPPGTDTLEQVRRVRQRYGRIALELRTYVTRAGYQPEQLPIFVAQGTILVREVEELVTQTFTLPPPPVLARILREYTNLVVIKVEKGL